MKKKLTLSIILHIFSLNLFSQNITVIGNSTKFSNFTLDNLEVVHGQNNMEVLSIKPNEYIPSPDTDFLIHFNDNSFKDEVGNYTITKHYNNVSNVEKKLGESSSYFIKNKEIVFSSNGDSIFSPGRLLGDFTLEFWLYPTIISDDTTIFSWKGVNKVDEDFISQKIKCYFENRQAIWEFDNLFIPVDFSSYNIKLKSKSKIIPNSWNHYLLRYNSELGMLEFLINGIPEDVKYTTKSQKEEVESYTPYVGNFSKNNIYIGERLNGFIDEFRISESFINDIQLSKYLSNGSFTTPVYQIDSDEVIIEDLIIQQQKLSETEIVYKYRLSNLPFEKDDKSKIWYTIKNKPKVLKGKYIQLRGDFYSNGNKTISPLFENFQIIWRSIPTPPAPQFLSSKAQKNSIEVTWSPVKHYDVDGYYLYYGNESNNYTEMIDVGKNTIYTVEKLIYKNIYYFSVRSYYRDKKSEYSIEKFNRPE